MYDTSHVINNASLKKKDTHISIFSVLRIVEKPILFSLCEDYKAPQIIKKKKSLWTFTHEAFKLFTVESSTHIVFWFPTKTKLVSLYSSLRLGSVDEDRPICWTLQPAVEHQRCPLLVQSQPGPDQNVQGGGTRISFSSTVTDQSSSLVAWDCFKRTILPNSQSIIFNFVGFFFLFLLFFAKVHQNSKFYTKALDFIWQTIHLSRHSVKIICYIIYHSSHWTIAPITVEAFLLTTKSL